MDEPTASLSRESVARLFEILRELRDSGRAIVYISHEIQEVFMIADRVTVLRDGRVTMTKPIAATSQDEVVRMMVGQGARGALPIAEARPARDRLVLRWRWSGCRCPATSRTSRSRSIRARSSVSPG